MIYRCGVTFYALATSNFAVATRKFSIVRGDIRKEAAAAHEPFLCRNRYDRREWNDWARARRVKDGRLHEIRIRPQLAGVLLSQNRDELPVPVHSGPFACR